VTVLKTLKINWFESFESLENELLRIIRVRWRNKPTPTKIHTLFWEAMYSQFSLVVCVKKRLFIKLKQWPRCLGLNTPQYENVREVHDPFNCFQLIYECVRLCGESMNYVVWVELLVSYIDSKRKRKLRQSCTQQFLWIKTTKVRVSIYLSGHRIYLAIFCCYLNSNLQSHFKIKFKLGVKSSEFNPASLTPTRSLTHRLTIWGPVLATFWSQKLKNSIKL
jgi:hypothetical protein